MFVKWSRTASTGRLVASLSEGRREGDTVRHTHIGMLATLRPANPRHPTYAERLAFWATGEGVAGSPPGPPGARPEGYGGGEAPRARADAGRAGFSLGSEPE
jgi:hypothetical protein